MFLVFVIVLILMTHSQKSSCQATCESRLTCRDCIRDPHICSWCTTADMRTPRCMSAKDANSSCDVNNIQNPRSNISTELNRDFSDASENYTQIRPQKIKIQIRSGDTQQFKYYFQPAKDYPLDLYFLIDFSKSMNSTVAKTAQEDISRALFNLTNNVHLGLGSFIDKKIMPFNINSKAYTYSFKNHLKLTPNTTAFSNAISSSKLGENFDASEGGFDALAQALVCKNEIGWRENSRKVIIFCTDESYHAAGDGKWARILTPYDGKCHMVNNTYTKELEMDYPSVSQINKLAYENDVTIFFAVNRDRYFEYLTLKDAISGSMTEQLENDAQAFVTKIYDMYKSLSQTLSMKININEIDINHIDVKINPDCTRDRGRTKNQCQLKNKEMKEFTANITLRDYYGVSNTNISIAPQGLNEMLTIDIEIIEACKCEREGIQDDLFCNKYGIYRCGICECKPERSGSNCQCVDSQSTQDAIDNASCIAGDSNLTCSGGRGACKCGRCECYPGYEGQYCQFSKDDCPGRTREGPCSLHGTCQYGICVCHIGWTGKKCDCPLTKDSCRHPNHLATSEVSECSGLGKCVCGGCQCRQLPDWDSRRQNRQYCYFEQCTECHELQCHILEACALCHHKNVNTSDACRELCDKNFIGSQVKKIDNHTEPWKLCPYLKTEVGCSAKFIYKYLGTDGIELIVETENDCMESYYVFGGTALGCVVLIGLLTLMTWKTLTRIRDHRDYEQFKKQYAKAEWNSENNPIYQSPNMTFHNPAFGGF